MRNRPWPLILLALFQILSPFGTVLFNAWALGVKPAYVLGWIFEKPFLKIFESLALMPIAGIAIYQMKAWSYAVFLVAMVWSLGSNLSNWSYVSKNYSLGMMILVYAFQIGLALYFMLPSVRRTYLDSRVRWWEAKRRFLLAGPITVDSPELQGEGQSGGQTTATIQNISEGGVLLSIQRALDPSRRYRLQFTVLGVPYEAQGQMVYEAPRSGESRTYGVQFVHTPTSKKAFKRLMKGLQLVGLDHRDRRQQKHWLIEIRDWATGVFKTGKGLVPEVKPDRKV
jgi:hypothetical protein